MLGVLQAWPFRASFAQVVWAVAKSVVAVVASVVAQISFVSTSCTSPAATGV